MQLFVSVIILSNFIFASKSCVKKSDVNFCDYTVSAEAIAKFPIVQKSGITLSTCLNEFENFNWSLGIYCSDLSFCGLGFDLTLDYRSLWDREEFSPAKRSCIVLTDVKEQTCEEVASQFSSAGLSSSKLNKLKSSNLLESTLSFVFTRAIC